MLDSVETTRIAAARAGDQHEFSGLTEPYRRELQVHCYRILGSLQDAEDLVQETMLRAWRRLDTFEGRASFRAWLYKIATHACFDALDKRPRRTLPAATAPAADPRQPVTPPVNEPIWLEPFPDEMLPDASQSPEARYALHESIRLAFLTALQILPARQRVVLLMRDVLAWRANEVAEMLELTVPAVNSALHRARTTLANEYHAGGMTERSPTPADETARALLERYVQVWETADMPGLLALLKEDAALSMPPSPSWYAGRSAIGAFASTTIFAGEARGRWRLLPTQANAQPAFGLYQRDEAGAYHAHSIQVVSLAGVQVTGIITFAKPELFARFNLPAELRA